MSQKLVALMKTFVTKKNFYRNESPTKAKASEEYANLQTVFEHFERILASVPIKKKSLVKGKKQKKFKNVLLFRSNKNRTDPQILSKFKTIKRRDL